MEMEIEEFRKYSKEMIDSICQYMTKGVQCNITPKVELESLKDLLPENGPKEGQSFKNAIDDLKTKIIPGLCQWRQKQYSAEMSTGISCISILSDLINSAIESIGFSWTTCPGAGDIERIVIDWYARALGLPHAFISDISGDGGGAFTGSTLEVTFKCMITARMRVIKMLKGSIVDAHDSIFVPQLTAYCSKEAHSSVKKAAKMALVKLRLIEADERCRMCVDLLKKTIRNDINAGLTPFFVVATSGTTGACAFDNLNEIGKVCQEVPSIWFHVDGAYGGNSFILPEMRHLAEGLEYADSFNTNPNKLLLTNFDASTTWIRDSMSLKETFDVSSVYSSTLNENSFNIRKRQFNALKLWFLFRTYGIEGLQEYVRNNIKLAKKFEHLVQSSDEFEVCNKVFLETVCFRMKAGDMVTKQLMARLNRNGMFFLESKVIGNKFCIRFCIESRLATEQNVVDIWTNIKDEALFVLKEFNRKSTARRCDLLAPQRLNSLKLELYTSQTCQKWLKRTNSFPLETSYKIMKG